MSVDFVNHHVHSHFSPLDGLSTPQDIVDRVVEMGQRSVSLTDHGFMSGIPQMARAAQNAGISFTPGIEAYFTKDRHMKYSDKLGERYYHMIMLAHTEEGYRNLVKLQTPSWEEGFYHKPRLDYELLDQYKEGLSITTSCLSGIVNRNLLAGKYNDARKELATLVDIMGKENVYVELQDNGIEDQNRILSDQLKLAKEFDLKLLATTDSHYTTKDQAEIHDTLLCCQTKSHKSETHRFKFDTDTCYLHSGEEMIRSFPEEDFPGAVSNTVELAEKTNFSLKMDKDKELIMPSVKTEDNKSEADTLREHVFAGARSPERYGDENGNIPKDVQERIEYELEVVHNMGFEGYFLIVENIVKLCAEHGIKVGPGRGCLHPETEVLTHRGWIPINDVCVGDYVVTSTGEVSPVIDTPVHTKYEGEKLIKLHNTDGETICVTEKHELLSTDRDGNKKWVKAKNIVPGQAIVSVYNNHNNGYEDFSHGGSLSKEPFYNEELSCAIDKTHQWGYVVGQLFSRSHIEKDTITMNFAPHENDFAETTLNCLYHCLGEDYSIDYSCDDNKNITEISFNSHTISSWMNKVYDNNDYFIGFGPSSYSRSFIQSVQSTFSGYPITDTWNVSSEFLACAVESAVYSLGQECDREDVTISLPNISRCGSQHYSTVTSIELVEAPDKVYDLTIGGDPSFLTRFSTVHNSAPGSVVVYCLGITNVDPFRHNLFFERFLNPDRISMPDIDIDVPKTKRNEALRLIEKEYGEGHVAHMSTYGASKDKDALERVAKVYELVPSQAEKFKNSVMKYCDDYAMSLQEFADLNSIPQEVQEKLPPTPYADNIIQEAAQIAGLISQYGVHACGIVITSDPVDEYFPLRFVDDRPLPVCQFDGDDTESLGGVKMDLLGLINLDECEDTEKNIAFDLGEEVDSSSLPLDDEKVYEMLSQGRGGGVFQLGCLSGDTVVDGKTIKEWYQRRNSTTRAQQLRSVFMGEGDVKFNTVRGVVYSGVKELLELEAELDTHIKATPEHHIFTQRGWVKMKDVEPGKDHVLLVDDAVGINHLPGTIRGREDVIEAFLEDNSGFEIFDHPIAIHAGNNRYIYPTLRKSEEPEVYVALIPDHGYDDVVAQEVNNNDSPIEVYSYSQVIEQYYANHPDADLLEPFSTQWVEVISIESIGEEKTYDIIMSPPVNNFIANGIMVHNSDGIQSLMRMMKPDNFEDISALVALYRPGPMGMKTHEEYSIRKNNPNKEIEYFHEDAREVLGDSYGLCVSGDTMIYDADTGALHRIDSIQDKVIEGMNTIGVEKDGTPVSARIEAWWCSGEKEIYRLQTSEGIIEASGDHPILTGNGWKNIKDVTSFDKVALTNSSMCVNVDQKINKDLSYLLGLLLGDGYNDLRSRNKYVPDIVYTLDHEKSMLFLAGIFNTDGYVSGNTAHVQNISKELSYGLHLLMNKLGYSSMVEESGNYISKNYGETVSYSLKTHDERFIKSIIPLLNHEDKKNVVVNSMEESSAYYVNNLASDEEIGMLENIRWVQVKSCVNTGNVEKVYDISVPDTKNFIANGNIVVSNCVYQENIMSIARKFAGYSGGEADELRKATAKKIPEMMDAQKKKFIPAVNKRYGGRLGQEIWDIIEPFGSYAFNRCLHGRTTVVTESDGSIRIEDLYRENNFHGKKILSMYPDGEIKYHTIKDIVQTGRKPVYTVKTKKGRTIMITEDHRMLTVEGYGTIKDGVIHVGQELISDDNENGKRKIYLSEKDRMRRSLGAIEAGRSEKSRNRAKEWMTYYQSTLTYEDRSKHQKEVQKNNPDRLKNSHITAKARLQYLRENDPEWVRDWGVKNALAHELSIQRSNEKNGRIGFGIRTKLSDGRIADSIVESLAGEYFISRNVDFEMHKTFVAIDGKIRITDFYADGIYFEMDGLNRGQQWFIDNKYGDSIPFVYMTPFDYKDKIDEALMRHNIKNGDEIIEIIPPRVSKKGEQYTEMTYDIEMEDDGPSNFIANGLVSHNSHSAAYGMLTYRTAWLKAHYPAQFSGACIDHTINDGDRDKVMQTMKWVKDEGVEINHPSIVSSELRTVTTKDSVTLPLSVIKGLGESKVQEILSIRDEKQFDSVVDVVSRVKMSKSLIISLAKSGAFDDFDISRARVVDNIDEIIAISQTKKSHDEISSGLFGEIIPDIQDDEIIDLSSDMDTIFIDDEKYTVDDDLYAQWERDTLGFILGTHPFETISRLNSAQSLLEKYPPVDEIREVTPQDEYIRYSGIISNIATRKSQRGNMYTTFTLETDKSIVNGICFVELPDELENTFVLIPKGRIESDSKDEDSFSPKAIVFGMKSVDIEAMKEKG